MKKKAIKKLVKKLLRKASSKKRTKLPAKPVQLMEVVRKKLKAFSLPINEPSLWRGIWVSESWNPTTFDYLAMDPFWMSTMSGRFAGRVLGETK